MNNWLLPATGLWTTDMSRRFVQQLADSDNLEEVYLVTDKQLRANRNGNLYLQIELGDRTGSISARLWNAGEHLCRMFEVGDFLLIRGKVQLFQGALQVILNHIERAEAEKVDLADFLPHTEQDVSKLLDRLRGALLRLANPHLRALAECFFMDDDFVRGFSQVPAGAHNLNPYNRGLFGNPLKFFVESAARVPPSPASARA